MSPHELKTKSLELAVVIRGPGSVPEYVVRTAEVFYNFLTGEETND